jgi:hypothetical protein
MTLVSCLAHPPRCGPRCRRAGARPGVRRRPCQAGDFGAWAACIAGAVSRSAPPRALEAQRSAGASGFDGEATVEFGGYGGAGALRMPPEGRLGLVAWTSVVGFDNTVTWLKRRRSLLARGPCDEVSLSRPPVPFHLSAQRRDRRVELSAATGLESPERRGGAATR